MEKSTMIKIESDYPRIGTLVDMLPVTSDKEKAETVALTEFQPKVNLVGQDMAQKGKVVQAKENDDFAEEYVIDASIAGCKETPEFLSRCCKTKSKIILTSITVKELEEMQKFHDELGRKARHILAMAAENQYNCFQPVRIDETVGIPDDCIIRYCEDHKDRVTLLTSDKTMALKARMGGVKTLYIRQRSNTNYTNTQAKESYNRKRISFPIKLIISNFNNNYRSIALISKGGFVYTDGVHSLNMGDNIYLATKKPEFMTFVHYRMISLSAKNNCELIYHTRLYKEADISYLPKEGYRAFMRDFSHRYDL